METYIQGLFESSISVNCSLLLATHQKDVLVLGDPPYRTQWSRNQKQNGRDRITLLINILEIVFTRRFSARTSCTTLWVINTMYFKQPKLTIMIDCNGKS